MEMIALKRGLHRLNIFRTLEGEVLLGTAGVIHQLENVVVPTESLEVHFANAQLFRGLLEPEGLAEVPVLERCRLGFLLCRESGFLCSPEEEGSGGFLFLKQSELEHLHALHLCYGRLLSFLLFLLAELNERLLHGLLLRFNLGIKANLMFLPYNWLFL